MIRVCADYGVRAGRVEGLTGTWIGDEKIGAIGIRISRWITSHGFAFNVNTALEHFDLIVPCGISTRGVTSLERAIGRTVTVADAEEAVVRHVCGVFQREATSAVPATA
jgi:lipoate-protein ligase B